MMNYTSTAADPHWHDEEMQWARVLATGDASRGMTIVFMQKLCTAFHEFEPLYRAGFIDERATDLARQRLGERVRMTIRVMETNGLSMSDGFAGLVALLERVEKAKSLKELAELTDMVHALGHEVCEGVELKQKHAVG
jgi:hypothetical protein